MKDPAPLPQGEEKAHAVRAMFDRIAPRYDLVNRVMTFGMDVGWRKRTVSALKLPRDATVLDLACGTGDLCRELVHADLFAVGIDLSMGMLRAAKTSSPLLQADALRLPVGDASVDGITCGFALRNVVDLNVLFSEMARVLRQGGRFALLEVAQPDSPLMRRGHALYFNKIVPWIGGLLSDRSAYSYLPRSAAYLPQRDEILDRLREVGFAEVTSALLPLGAAQIISGTRG